jgi:hypothetical protein
MLRASTKTLIHNGRALSVLGKLFGHSGPSSSNSAAALEPFNVYLYEKGRVDQAHGLLMDMMQSTDTNNGDLSVKTRFNWIRADVYSRLGQPQQIVEAIASSVADYKDNGNSPVVSLGLASMLMSMFDYIAEPKRLMTDDEASQTMRDAFKAVFSLPPEKTADLADQGTLLLRLTRVFKPQDPFIEEISDLFQKNIKLASVVDKSDLGDLLVGFAQDLVAGVKLTSQKQIPVTDGLTSRYVKKLCKTLREGMMNDKNLEWNLPVRRLFRVAVLGEVDYRVEGSSEDLLEMAIPFLLSDEKSHSEDTWGLFNFRLRLLKSYLSSNPYSQSEFVSNLMYLLFSHPDLHPAIVSDRAAILLFEIADQFLYYERFEEARGVLDCYLSTISRLRHGENKGMRVQCCSFVSSLINVTGC